MISGYFFWKSRWIKIILGIFGIVLGIYLGTLHRSSSLLQEIKTPEGPVRAETTIISPQGVHIAVLVADTDSERAAGLSGFSLLKEHQGMLFVFPQVGIYSFWMKDMNFPLDIVWIDQNNIIVDRAIKVLPESYPKTFTSHTPVARVLELPANTADKYGLTLGSVVKIQNNK